MEHIGIGEMEKKGNGTHRFSEKELIGADAEVNNSRGKGQNIAVCRAVLELRLGQNDAWTASHS